MALDRLPFTRMDRGIEFYVTTDGDLDLSPAYQCGQVWDAARKRALIESVLRGIPIGALTLNDRSAAEAAVTADDPLYAVIDGKQRITALREFVTGEFSVPSRWFPTEHLPEWAHTRVMFPHLSKSARRRFLNIPLPALVASVPTLAEEALVFGLINFGGIPQDTADTPVSS